MNPSVCHDLLPASVPKVTRSSDTSILSVFCDIEVELRESLASLKNWGLSGQRDGQYVHDLVADDLIVKRLLTEGFRVLSEESGVVGEGEITVVVDPIDGSTNASHGLPWYALSLCAVDNEGPAVSLVANLGLDVRYEAVRRGGARKVRSVAGTAESVEIRPSGVTVLSDALISFSGWPPEHGGWRQYRTYGACALDLCAVADGTFDAFVDVDSAHGVWDYVGGLLVCREASASAADATGRELVVLEHEQRRAPVAAASPELLVQVLEMRSLWQSNQQG